MHLRLLCPEHKISCEYAEHGCDVKIKRKLMADHLETEEVAHLKMKVQYAFIFILNVVLYSVSGE